MTILSKMKKLFRLFRYRKPIYGQIGTGNVFAPGVEMLDRARLGSYNYLGNGVIIGNASIGNYCSIAPNSLVGPANHGMDLFSTSQLIGKRLGYDLFGFEPAVLEDDVWIGANSVVLQGVTVGTGAVVGANSFVNRDVPPYAIVAGSPARFLGYRFNSSCAEKLIGTRWWEQKPEEAVLLVDRFMENGDE